MDITNDLLDELEQKAKAAGSAEWGCIDGIGVDADHRLITTQARIGSPTVQIATIHYGHPDAGMLEPFQSEQVAAGEHIAAANPAAILALVEHIRSLSERLEKAEKEAERCHWLIRRVGVLNDGYSTVWLPSSRTQINANDEAVTRSAIDAAIAQEADHE